MLQSSLPSSLSQKWQVFIVTYVTYAVLYITRKSFSVVKTLIQEDLGLSTYVLGTIDSAFLGTYALFQIFLPSLCDVVGVRPVLLCALWAAASFSLTFAISYSPSALIYSWLLEGVAHAPVFAVLVKAVSLWFLPGERSRVLGVWTTSQQIGGIVATTSATFVSTRFGWRATFTMAAIVTAGTAILVSMTLPEPPLPTASESIEKSTIEFSTVTTKRRKSATFPTSRLVTDRSPTEHSNSIELNEEDTQRCQSLPSGVDLTDGGLINRDGLYVNSDGCISARTLTDSTKYINVPITARSHIPLTPSTESSIIISTISPDSVSIQPMKFFDVLRIPNLAACGLSYFCVKLVRYTLLLWLPYFLFTEMNFGTSLAGYSSMLFDVGGVFGAIASGFLAEHVFKGKRLTSAAVMCIATSISLLCFGLVSVNNKTQLVLQNGSLIHLNTTGHNNSISLLNSTDPLLDPFLNLFPNQSNQTLTSEIGKFLQPEPSANVSLRFLRRRDASELNRFRIRAPITSDRIPENHSTRFIATLVLMTLVGFFIAGPDSILGASSAGLICERSGIPSAQLALSTATGIVNGLGAFGGVVQGYSTAFISETWGWSMLFFILSGASFLSVIALWRCIAEDWSMNPTAIVNTSGGRYTPVLNGSSKKDDKTTD